MPLKNQWMLNIVMVSIAWLSIPLLGKRNIIRFLPASLLILILEAVNAQIGKKRKWWVFYNKPSSFMFGEFPFIVGPFFAVSLWILKWTYGNIKQYLLMNIIFNLLFAYPYSMLAKKIKYFRLNRLNSFTFFLYFFSKAPILYGFQYLLEKCQGLIIPPIAKKPKKIPNT